MSTSRLEHDMPVESGSARRAMRSRSISLTPNCYAPARLVSPAPARHVKERKNWRWIGDGEGTTGLTWTRI